MKIKHLSRLVLMMIASNAMGKSAQAETKKVVNDSHVTAGLQRMIAHYGGISFNALSNPLCEVAKTLTATTYHHIKFTDYKENLSEFLKKLACNEHHQQYITSFIFDDCSGLSREIFNTLLLYENLEELAFYNCPSINELDILKFRIYRPTIIVRYIPTGGKIKVFSEGYPEGR